MDYKGLTSFSIGGTIVLMVFWNLLAHVDLLQGGYATEPLIFSIFINALFIFLGFLLVGLGLKSLIKGTN